MVRTEKPIERQALLARTHECRRIVDNVYDAPVTDPFAEPLSLCQP
jgi:hypothetical protein